MRKTQRISNKFFEESGLMVLEKQKPTLSGGLEVIDQKSFNTSLYSVSFFFEDLIGLDAASDSSISLLSLNDASFAVAGFLRPFPLISAFRLSVQYHPEPLNMIPTCEIIFLAFAPHTGQVWAFRPTGTRSSKTSLHSVH